MIPVVVPLTVRENAVRFGLNVATDRVTCLLGLDTVINASIYGKRYEGDYVVTPTDDEVVLETKDLMMTDNLVINPIPSNYGKIGWNGSYITVT